MPATLEAGQSADQQRLSSRLRQSRPAGGAAINWDPRGWLTRSLPDNVDGQREPLAVHASWAGPVKLVERKRRCLKVCEVYLAHGTTGDDLLDPRAREEIETLLGQLIDGPLSGATRLDGPWEPPAAADLARWLNDAGYTAAIDEQQNVRLALKSRGCDGQVRITRGESSLRASMQLGAWKQLDAVAERAMLLLARQCNAGCRLVRITWTDAEAERRCDAQVDLSGLPTGDLRDALWRDMVRAAMNALELSLRQLGLELNALADPRHAHLAQRVVAGGRRRRKPR